MIIPFVVGDDWNVALYQIIHHPLDQRVIHADGRATRIRLVHSVKKNNQP